MTSPVTVVAVVVGTTYGANAVKKKPLTIKPLIAGWILGLFLFVIDEVSPDIGSAFGALAMVSALLVNGGDLFPAIGKVIK